MQTAQTRLHRFARESNQTSKWIAGAVSTAMKAAPLAVGYAMVKLGRAAEEFQQSLNSSMAIMGNFSDSMRRDLADTAIKVASQTIFSANETAKAYYFLASAGLTAGQSLKVLPTVAQFAQAGLFGLSRSAEMLSDAQSALGLKTNNVNQNMLEMARIADVLVKANTLSNASVEQFAIALTNKAGAALKFVNKSVEEGVAVLAAFAAQGVKAEDAGTALNIVFRDLTTKAIEHAGAFERNRIAVFDAQGQMRNMADIVQDLERRLSGMSDETKKATLLSLGFADRSVSFIQALLGQSEAIRKYESALKDASGITKEISGKQMTDMQKGLAETGAAWVQFARYMQPTVDLMGNLVDNFGKFLGALGTLDQTINPDVKGSRALAPGEVVFDPSVTADQRQAFFRRREQEIAAQAAAEKAAAAQQEADDKALAARKKLNEEFGKSKAIIADLHEQMMPQLSGPQKTLATLEDRYSQGLASESSIRYARRLVADFEFDAKQKERFEQDTNRAEQIATTMRSPFEVFRDAVLELKGFMERGLITGAVFERARDAAAETLRDAITKTTSGTFRSRSSAELGISSAAGSSGMPLLARSNQVQFRQLDVLEEIRDEIRSLSVAGLA